MSSSQSSMYTKYLELQIRMLQQASTQQGPNTNSNEFGASQSCSSNSNQQGYIQTTPSSVRTSEVAPQGPSSSNEQGNQQGPTTYNRAPNRDGVVLKLNSTRSEALQVISNLKSKFHTNHHREVVHISYERTLIDSLQKLYENNKAERDSCDFWNRWTRERFIAHLELIWPQTVCVAEKSFLEAIRDLHVQYAMSDAKVELQTFTDLMNIHRHYTHRTQEDNYTYLFDFKHYRDHV